MAKRRRPANAVTKAMRKQGFGKTGNLRGTGGLSRKLGGVGEW